MKENKENILVKGYKFRIYPNKPQKEYLDRVFGCCRFVYNHYLSKAIADYEKYTQDSSLQKPNINVFSICKDLVLLKNVPEFLWLKEAPTHVLQDSVHKLGNAYNGFFKNKKGYPKFKKKQNKQSVTFSVFSYVLKDKVFKLAKCKESFKVKWSRDLPTESPGPVTVSKTPDGKYYASFMCSYASEKTTGTKFTGIDAGITDLATFSDGTSIENPRHYKKLSKQLVKQQRQLSRKKKGSKNRNKARLKVAKIHAKIANQRNDYLHKLTTWLVRENQAIAIERLMIKNMVKNHRLAKHILDASWGKMRDYLKYKSIASNHCKLFLADPYFPSTQLCSHCGMRPKEKIKLGVTRWTCCNCGSVHQRDHNAAKNLEILAISQFKMCAVMGIKESVVLTENYVPFYP